MMSSRAQNGTITLTVVFLTAMALLILAFGDHVRVLRQAAAVTTDAATEQSFYAAQSCVEEGYLQLRENADYVMTNPLVVGDGNCTLEIEPDVPHGTSGKLSGIGKDRTTVRGVVSRYTDAGPTASRADTSIFHILDRSGSMMEDSCSNHAYRTQADCINHHETWGPLQPMTDVKNAAIALAGMLDPHHDDLGLVSYSTNATFDQALTHDNNYQTVTNAINAMVPDGYTNIGKAINIGTAHLPPASSGRMRIEIVLTDGVANRPVNEATAIQYAKDQADAARADGVIIFTIGLGTTLNETLLQYLASDINGTRMYFHAPDASALQDIYTRIANLIVSYNISQSSWKEE